MTDDTQQEFAFEDAGRRFTCEVETPHRPHAGTWWWFRVSTEAHQRYAPFRAAAGDTRDDVRARVVAYYDHLLARRAEPAVNRWRRRPATPPTTPATDATTDATAR